MGESRIVEKMDSMSGKKGGVDMMRAKRGVGSRLGRWGDDRGQEGHIDKGV